MDEIHLKVVVPRNRNLDGWLYVEKGGAQVDRMRVLARGSQGPGDTQFQTNGNTPTGTYDGSVFVSTKDFPQDSYGPWGAVRLTPTSGNALTAERVFGRTGLLIHGGDLSRPGYWRGANQLRATYGCLRVSNDDMLRLRNWLLHDEKRGLCRVTPPKVVVSVQE